jgi:hypothetical protein
MTFVPLPPPALIGYEAQSRSGRFGEKNLSLPVARRYTDRAIATVIKYTVPKVCPRKICETRNVIAEIASLGFGV